MPRFTAQGRKAENSDAPRKAAQSGSGERVTETCPARFAMPQRGRTQPHWGNEGPGRFVAHSPRKAASNDTV